MSSKVFSDEPVLRVKFYGTRGSLPVCDPGYQEFGGNTTCVGVFNTVPGKDILILDAGTGIRNLGRDLMRLEFEPNQTIKIAFSHFHWDHIQGFPFFAPAYDPTKKIELFVMGENPTISNLRDVLAYQMESTYFPVPLHKMGANFSFGMSNQDLVEFPEGRLQINEHSHPGGALGYRLEFNNKVLVFCTDVEHGNGIDQNVVELSRGADILIHEAQYTPEELPNYRGWGHSSWEQAIEVAEQAGAKRLYITHHDPSHDDNFLLEVEGQCQKRFTECYLAREGEEILI